MASAAAYAAIAGVVVAAGGTALSINAQNEAQDAAEKRNKLNQAVEGFKSKRERIAARRQNRVQRAQIFAQSAAAGTQTSSGVSGFISSSKSQEASAFGAAGAVNEGRQESLDLALGINQSLGRAQQFQQVASLGPAVGQGISSSAKLLGIGQV